MYHDLCKIVKVSIPKLYHVSVTFDDGVTKTIDLEPILYGQMFGPLRDEKVFRQVEIDPIAETIQWPNGADFDPAVLYHWEEYKKELAERAREWA